MRNLMYKRAQNGLRPLRLLQLFAALGGLIGISFDVTAQTCSSSIGRTRPDSRYELVTGATPAGSEVRDKVTGLIWQRCVQGMTWNGSTCSGVAIMRDWGAALDQGRTAVATSATPATPWRVPNRVELLSLPERACHLPAINTAWFPAEPGGWVWSSSPLSDYPERAWNVYFDYGNDSYANKGDAGAVRLVRSGQ